MNFGSRGDVSFRKVRKRFRAWDGSLSRAGIIGIVAGFENRIQISRSLGRYPLCLSLPLSVWLDSGCQLARSGNNTSLSTR